MSLDRDRLARAVAAHGALIRVVVAATAGSAPREPGAQMLVWPASPRGGQPWGQSGTIGGGALEYAAARDALAQLRQGTPSRCARIALGPARGQCCGGAVTLVSERIDAAFLDRMPGDVLARPVAVGAGPDAGPEPLGVARARADLRAGNAARDTILADGWLVERVAHAAQPLWVFGAGHVGRALVATLAPLPDFRLCWIDTAAARFPPTAETSAPFDRPAPPEVEQIVATDPARLVAHAPRNGWHLILSFSHTLDLRICDALLHRGFGWAGLIGSRTKWARFQRRLSALGHAPGAIASITCPIGDPGLGKHPQAIALGVGADLLARRRRDQHSATTQTRQTGGRP